MKHKMFESVFNGHINNADKKARLDHLNEFGRVGYRRLYKFLRKGAMAIFIIEPNSDTMFYATRVQSYVNQKGGK